MRITTFIFLLVSVILFGIFMPSLKDTSSYFSFPKNHYIFKTFASHKFERKFLFLRWNITEPEFNPIWENVISLTHVKKLDILRKYCWIVRVYSGFIHRKLFMCAIKSNSNMPREIVQKPKFIVQRFGLYLFRIFQICRIGANIWKILTF